EGQAGTATDRGSDLLAVGQAEGALAERLVEPGGVGQEVPEAHTVAAAASELGDDPRDRVVQQDPAALDLLHDRGREDRLGDRGEQEDRVDRDRPERLRAQELAAVRDREDARWERASRHAVGDDLEGVVEALWLESGHSAAPRRDGRILAAALTEPGRGR